MTRALTWKTAALYAALGSGLSALACTAGDAHTYGSPSLEDDPAPADPLQDGIGQTPSGFAPPPAHTSLGTSAFGVGAQSTTTTTTTQDAGTVVNDTPNQSGNGNGNGFNEDGG